MVVRYFGGVGLGIQTIYANRSLKGIHYVVMQQSREAGKNARDVLLGLMKTCIKLDVSFFRYLGDRLGIPAQEPIPPLPLLVRQAAQA